MKKNFIYFLLLLPVFLSCKDDPPQLITGTCDNGYYNGTEYHGNATWYDHTGKGNCGIEFPQDGMFGAMNQAQYANSNACGGWVEVSNEDTDETIIIQILDQCPECAPGNIDLSAQAFAKLAPLGQGGFPIKWHYIECPDDRDMKIRFKKGSNQWWTAVQVIDHRYMIHSVEGKNQDGVFTPMVRHSYNYFIDTNGIKDGKQDGPFELRITDVAGHSITRTCQHTPNVIQSTNQQFESCK